MKQQSKKFNRKLALNKKTIAHLDGSALGDLKGGTLPTIYMTICRSECITNCPLCPSMDTKCPDCL